MRDDGKKGVGDIVVRSANMVSTVCGRSEGVDKSAEERVSWRSGPGGLLLLLDGW